MISLKNFSDQDKNIFLIAFSIIKNLLDSICHSKKSVKLPIVRHGFESWISDESVIINNILFERIYNDSNIPILAIKIYNDSGTMVQFSRNRKQSLTFDHIYLQNGPNNINIYISNFDENVIIFNVGDSTYKKCFSKETRDVEIKTKFVELINIVNEYIKNKYYRYNNVNYKTCKSWGKAKKFLRGKNFKSFSRIVVIKHIERIAGEITGMKKMFDDLLFETSDVNNLLDELEYSL